jgi:hypothetical protein
MPPDPAEPPEPAVPPAPAVLLLLFLDVLLLLVVEELFRDDVPPWPAFDVEDPPDEHAAPVTMQRPATKQCFSRFHLRISAILSEMSFGPH